MKTLNRPLTFTSDHWITLSAAVTETFRLTEAESRGLFESRTARLIAALPFLAGCDQPERTSLTHLSVYLMASRGPTRWTFDHGAEDDVDPCRRLACIGTFQGGDSVVLGRGMRLLVLQMVCGYARDQAKDTVTGEYNPLLEGTWDARSMIDGLVAEIVERPCGEMDGIMTIHDAQTYWWL
jgi:hypothetical protein